MTSNHSEFAVRQSIVDACRSMNALGINQGTSGNISLRHGEGLLITPTSTPRPVARPTHDRRAITEGRCHTTSASVAVMSASDVRQYGHADWRIVSDTTVRYTL